MASSIDSPTREAALSAARQQRADAGDIVRREILGTGIDPTSYPAVLARLADWLAEPRGRYVCLANVFTVMIARDDAAFRDVIRRADLVTPDGMPLVWGLRVLGARRATRVYGPDLTPLVCAWAAEHGVPVGFYGSSPTVLARLVANLTARYPGLPVVYRHSPPFRALGPQEHDAEIAAIRSSGCRLLFVGLGCPKQERWMAERRDELDAVMLGVGAAFDFLAGTKPMAPDWIQALGLEWLFRLLSEPRRLWRRYLFNNPRFLGLFAAQLLREQRAVRLGWRR